MFGIFRLTCGRQTVVIIPARPTKCPTPTFSDLFNRKYQCAKRGERSQSHTREKTTMASSWRNIQDDDDDDEEEFRPEVRPRDVAGVTQPRQTRNPPP